MRRGGQPFQQLNCSAEFFRQVHCRWTVISLKHHQTFVTADRSQLDHDGNFSFMKKDGQCIEACYLYVFDRHFQSACVYVCVDPRANTAL